MTLGLEPEAETDAQSGASQLVLADAQGSVRARASRGRGEESFVRRLEADVGRARAPAMRGREAN